MKVVFYEDVEGTALVGDVKDVKNGFARNFLLPRGLAGAATRDNLQHATALAQKEAVRQARLDAEAQAALHLREFALGDADLVTAAVAGDAGARAARGVAGRHPGRGGAPARTSVCGGLLK